MSEADIEVIPERASELHLEALAPDHLRQRGSRACRTSEPRPTVPNRTENRAGTNRLKENASGRLNGAVDYITPKDMLAGWQQEIHTERDRKLEEHAA